jgi:hypothetical protein
MGQNLRLESFMRGLMIGWIELKIKVKVQNAQKSENRGNSSFWCLNYRFFQKKVAKSELRGGAGSGTHVSRNFFYTIKLLSCMIYTVSKQGFLNEYL